MEHSLMRRLAAEAVGTAVPVWGVGPLVADEPAQGPSATDGDKDVELPPAAAGAGRHDRAGDITGGRE